MAQSKSLTVEEALELLVEISDDEEFKAADIFIYPPPNERDNVLTDEDSGADDAIITDNLTGKQLHAPATLSITKLDQSRKCIGDEGLWSDDEEPSMVASTESRKNIFKICERQWISSDLPSEKKANISWEVPKAECLEIDWSPVSIFEEFISDELLDIIAEQSILYARQKGNTNFSITQDELRVFFAILMTSGYDRVPQRRLYWSSEMDVQNPAISSAMCRNRFDQIMQCFHFADNKNLNKRDKFAKIRPFFYHLNEKFLHFQPNEQQISVGATTVPYYGQQGRKQLIRGKPIQIGYKLWCLNTRLGYLIQFKPHQGAGTVADLDNLGMGGSIVMDLISELPENLHYDLFCDNLFTSPVLIDNLSTKGFNVTGMMHPKRIENCPLDDVSFFKKLERGTFQYMFDKANNNVLLVRCNDKGVITVGSNVHGIHPVVKAKRWSKVEKKIIEIDQPSVIAKYNQCKIGTERMNQNIETYRCSIRSKKWWWPLFVFGLEAAIQNAWQLYRLCPTFKTKPLQLLHFRREICLTYFLKYAHTNADKTKIERPLVKPRRSRCKVPDAVRYDEKKHYIIPNKTQVRCAYCGKKVSRKCSKCMVGLHERCFQSFHTMPE